MLHLTPFYVLPPPSPGHLAARLWTAFARAYDHAWVKALPRHPDPHGYPSLSALQDAVKGRAGANIPYPPISLDPGGLAHQSSSGRVRWCVSEGGMARVAVLRPHDVIVIQVDYLPRTPLGPLLEPHTDLVLCADYQPRHLRELRTLLTVLERTGGVPSRMTDICRRMIATGVTKTPPAASDASPDESAPSA
jgi:hypothetical protein